MFVALPSSPMKVYVQKLFARNTLSKKLFYDSTMFFPLCLLEIRTFEVLLRTYEVREESLVPLKPDYIANSMENKIQPPLHKKRFREGVELSTESVDNSGIVGETNNTTTKLGFAMARPVSETRGHTGYLTFGVHSL